MPVECFGIEIEIKGIRLFTANLFPLKEKTNSGQFITDLLHAF